jgi:polar amino acid transport system substrate-binding protein
VSAFKDLAPSGTLRVGIAVGPTIGAAVVAIEKGKPRGIAVDLGTELARRLGVPVKFVSYPSLGPLADAAGGGNWDVAFVAFDEEKKKLIDYGAAHIVRQFTYMVAPHSDIQTMADVDRLGVRVVGAEGTAAVRAAQASLKNVQIFQAKSSTEVFELLRTGKADAMTSSRETLLGLSKKLPGSRVLDGSYLNSYVAIAVPKGRSAGLAYASAFVEDVKANGMVRRSLDNAGLTTTRVAPAGVKP